MTTETLFRPFTLKGLSLPNRIVMAPMTRNQAPEGIPGTAQAEYYSRRAAAEVGLIITEGTVVNRPGSRNSPGIPKFYAEQPLAGWETVVQAVHAVGGKLAPQLWHTGSTRGSKWQEDSSVESPSGLVGPGDPRGNTMSESDIAQAIEAFAASAKAAVDLGVDAIELHGAHGYLIDQFFWADANLRADGWGGATLPERSRFAAEIIRAVRREIGDTPLIIRVSQWKQQDYRARLADTPEKLKAWLLPLVEAGVDILHCSQRRFWEPEFPELDGEEGLNLAGWAKKVTGAATISVGSVGLNSDFNRAFVGESSSSTSLQGLITRMERDEFDLIAVGRALISDPQWARKVHAEDWAALNGFSAADLAQLH